MKDFVGHELVIGQAVVWGVGGRRSHGLRFGEVAEFDPSRRYGDTVRVVSLKSGVPGGWKRPDHLAGLHHPDT